MVSSLQTNGLLQPADVNIVNIEHIEHILILAVIIKFWPGQFH